MSKRKQAIAQQARDHAGSHAEAIEAKDAFKDERKVFFEQTSVSMSGKTEKMTSIEAYYRSELQRENKGEQLGIQIAQKLKRVIDKQHRESELEQQEGLSSRARFLQQKADYQRVAFPFFALSGYVASCALAQEYAERIGPDAKVDLIKPYWVNEANWEEARRKLAKMDRRRQGEDYEVGYRKPPKEQQFKESGNLDGRPKRAELWSRLKSAQNAPVSVKTAEGREIKMPRGELAMRNLLRCAISGEVGPRRELVRKILEIQEAGHLAPLPPKPRRRRKKLDANELERLGRSMDLYVKAFIRCVPQLKERLRPYYERKYGSGHYVDNSIIDYEYFANSSGSADGEISDVVDEAGDGKRAFTYAVPKGIYRKRTRDLQTGTRRQGSSKEGQVCKRQNQ